MLGGPLFSAVVKPDKPLLYISEQPTLISNIAVSPIPSNEKKPKTLTAIPPFVTVLKLQYHGPTLDGDEDEDGEDGGDEQKGGVKKDAPQKGKKDTKKVEAEEEEDDEDDDEDSDFHGRDIEAKEVVVGCFTPNILQITTDLFLEEDDAYRFVLSGSADYEVHLLGRYLNTSPGGYRDSDDDSMDDFDLDQMSSGEDDSDESRIQEIGDEDEEMNNSKVTVTSSSKPKTALTSQEVAKAKTSNLQDTTKSKKRAREDKDVPAGATTAHPAADAVDGEAHLSKSQRKKLKKAQRAAAGNRASEQNQDAKAKPDGPKANGDNNKPKTEDSKKSSTSPTVVTLPSGLKITDTKVGQGAEAKAGQEIAMRYIGKLANGKVFDSNTKGSPFVFKLGRGEVITGWDEGIKGIKVGGERRLVVPANLAYGKNGAPPDIPPNSTLMFDVKCLSIK